MKRTLFIMSAVVLLAGLVGLSGCCCHRPHACCGNQCCYDTCNDCAATCQPSDCGNCGECSQCGICDRGYDCVQTGECMEGCQGVENCGYCEGIGGRFRGFMGRLCPWGHGHGNGYGAQAADPSDGGAFGQGTGGVVAYPYYTTRGPRDFLLNNPPSIGP